MSYFKLMCDKHNPSVDMLYSYAVIIIYTQLIKTKKNSYSYSQVLSVSKDGFLQIKRVTAVYFEGH